MKSSSRGGWREGRHGERAGSGLSRGKELFTGERKAANEKQTATEERYLIDVGERERQRGWLRVKQTVTECTENKIKVHAEWGGGQARDSFPTNGRRWLEWRVPAIPAGCGPWGGVGAIRMDASGRRGRRGVDSHRARN